MWLDHYRLLEEVQAISLQDPRWIVDTDKRMGVVQEVNTPWAANDLWSGAHKRCRALQFLLTEKPVTFWESDCLANWKPFMSVFICP